MNGSGAIASPVPAASPGRSAVAWSRLVRQLRRIAHRVRSGLGIRRGLKVRGAYFKELTSESLQRALSKKGRGWKDYRVTFPDGAKLVIRCSAQRIFDDLMGPLGFDAGQGLLAPLLDIIRPGSRLLLVQSGTGSAGAWLGAAVGSSGSVVALEEDEQSVAFAARRYPRPNVSFELGGIDGLNGETDGAFDGAAIVRPLQPQTAAVALAEVWRVVAPGGWLLVACPQGEGGAVADIVRALPSGDAAGIRADVASGPDLVFATKSTDEPAEPAPKRPPAGPRGRPPEAGPTASG